MHAVFLYIYRTPDSVPFDGIVPIFALVRKVCRSGNWTVDRHCPQFLFLVSKLLLSTSSLYMFSVLMEVFFNVERRIDKSLYFVLFYIT